MKNILLAAFLLFVFSSYSYSEQHSSNSANMVAFVVFNPNEEWYLVELSCPTEYKEISIVYVLVSADNKILSRKIVNIQKGFPELFKMNIDTIKGFGKYARVIVVKEIDVAKLERR